MTARVHVAFARFALPFAFILVAACGAPPSRPRAPQAAPAPDAPVAAAPPPAPRPRTPDEPFRAAPPPLAAPMPFAQPRIQQLRLKNGIPVYFIERHATPFFRAEVIGMGLPSKGERLNSRWMMASSLEKGTTTLSDVYAVGDALTGAFAVVSEAESVGEDAVSVALTARSDKADVSLALLADLVRNPTFDEKAFSFTLDYFIGRVTQATGDGVLAERALQAAIGDDPASLLDGRTADLHGMTRADLVRAHRSTFDSKATAIVVAGDVRGAELLDALNRGFGDWASTPPAARRAAPKAPLEVRAPSEARPRLVVIDRPGAPSAHVAVGNRVDGLRTFDWWTLLAIRTQLAFEGKGRLLRLLRDELQLTADVRIALRSVPSGRSYEIHVDVARENAVTTTRVLLEQLAAARGETPSDSELSTVKAGLRRAIPGWIATNHEVVETLSALARGLFTSDEADNFAASIAAVTPTGVHALAHRLFAPGDTVVVIVGDWASIQPDFTPLGWRSVEVHKAP